MTVPGLWSDRSKALMRRAGLEAGLPGNIDLETESRAIALYCATICDGVDLRIGSKFVGRVEICYRTEK